MPTITDASPTPDEQGAMTGEATGAGTPTATPEARTFTQAELDTHIEERLTRERKRSEKELETKVAAAIAERDKAYETAVAERIKAALAERDLLDTRRGIQSEYGLSDAQLARLSGDTPDALKADAETLFGALKTKKPPVLNPGTPPAAPDAPLDLTKMSPAQIREKSAELMKQATR